MHPCPVCARPLEDGTRFCPYDGTPVAHVGIKSGEARIGTLVDDRYELVELLGQGGMASVYRARSTELGEEVAVKVLLPSLTDRPIAIARFARESRAASRIDHPNVVRVLDFGYTTHGFYFLVMELLRGTSLENRIHKGPISLPRSVHILAQIAAGMASAHSIGVVHRDLKPANVLLVSGEAAPDFVKVVDFGLARANDMAEAALTREGETFGTPQYMAPEQWCGHTADARTDIYAWGVTAFQVFTGALPFAEPDVPRLMRAHVTTPAPSLAHRSRSVPPALVELVAHALQKDQRDRPASFDEVLDRLRAIPVAPVSVRLSYGAARALPLDLDAPTELDLGTITHPTHAPALHGEIQRLRRVRDRRVRELAAALWPHRPPTVIAELMERVAAIESELERCGAELAAVEAELAAAEAKARTEEVDLRLRLIEASLRRAKLIESLPFESTPVAEPPVEVAAHALGEHRAQERALLSRLHAMLAEQIRQLAAYEETLAPIYEELSAHVRKACAGRGELRSLMDAFACVDGAIASHHSLLTTLAARA